jgi:hypothetical protein
MNTTPQQYWVRVAGGTVAFAVWLLSVIVLPGATAPIVQIDTPYQAALFAAAAAVFGWATYAGGQAIAALSEQR